MINILHVAGSPRKEQSVSARVTSAYLDAFTKKNPDCLIETLDIWNAKLPELNKNVIDAKYAGLNATKLNKKQSQSWESIKKIADQFHRADLILFSIPMWNFGIPYKLKQLIDLISHKDILFTFDEGCFDGMLINKKAVLISARGVNYATGTSTPESEFDFQNSYMLMWLRFIGITDVEIFKVEQTLFGRAAALQAENDTIESAIRSIQHTK